MGRQGPFIATLISASNHHPFRSPEPELDMAGHDTVQQRIRNTVRYTDDVVASCSKPADREPWFERTLIVINSDHGYNLGEHGGMVGAYSLYRESTWTPFLIVGAHPRLPAGRHDNVVTLLDVAPTIADMLGLREANPWHGHSLLRSSPDRRIQFAFRDSLLAESRSGPRCSTGRTGGRGSTTPARLAAAARRGRNRPALVRGLLADAERRRRYNDCLIRHGRVWPREGNVVARADPRYLWQ